MEKTVLITGTSSGLGKELVKYFASHNWKVIATSRKPQKEWEDNKQILEKQLDVTDEESITKLFEEFRNSGTRIDVIVNNAGKAALGALEHISLESVKEIFNVNVLGVIRILKAIIPLYRKQNHGKIINVSSLIGCAADIPLASIYAMSKFALEGLTEGAYYELKALNIDIHLVEPGGFKSSLIENAITSPILEDTVYNEINTSLNKLLEGKNLDPNSPHTEISEIVQKIFKISEGEIKKFRNPVGTDTAEILSMRSENTIEQYLEKISEKFSIS